MLRNADAGHGDQARATRKRRGKGVSSLLGRLVKWQRGLERE